MASAKTDGSRQERPLRLWPGVVAVVVQWATWYLVPILVPTTAAGYAAALGGVGGGLIVVLWWLFFSRAAWSERLGAIGLMVVGLAVTSRIVDESVATAGMGMLLYIAAIPILSLALVAWAVATRNLSDGVRRVTMVATLLAACGGWALVRTEGVSATGSHFAWRWSQTAEERLLAEAGADPTAGAGSSRAAEVDADWPGFRGSLRDGVVHGPRIETDWAASPPVEVWRRPVGPGWSSFAVQGDRLFTQEQRGDDEVVVSYDRASGAPVWIHRDAARFWESNGGAGPRGTPTLRGGRVYTFGATGILNVLEAGDGARVWSRDVAADTGVEIPYWGFSSSPVVVEDVVIVAAEGKLAAYDLASGDSRWFGPEGGGGHSSPHLLTLDGTTQVLLLSGTGAVSMSPDGRLLWEHEWSGYPVVQPAIIGGGDILINGGEGVGVRRLAVEQGAGGWTTEERWTSTRLKPYFNDFVIHKGHAIGFDGSILACIDLENGERKWKGGRYGQGQLILLADQDLLLVISEKGELALVSANSESFTEHARFPAIEGKTWNHPVLVDDLLLVRNAEEMAAFRLALTGG